MSQHTTIVADPDEEIKDRVAVDENNPLTNTLIDITAPGAAVDIEAYGSNWEIRNVGVKGRQGKNEDHLTPAVTDPDGTGIVENVYFGDGIEDDLGSAGGIWVDATQGDRHRGRIIFKNVYMFQSSDNGFYCSGPSAQVGNFYDSYDDAGNVTIDSCYARSNQVANYRIALDDDIVKNSVAVGYHDEMKNPDKPDKLNSRGIRAVDGNGSQARAVNCRVETPSDDALEAEQGSRMRVEDTPWNGGIDRRETIELINSPQTTDVDLTPPAGVPMDAKAAATGESGTVQPPDDGNGGDSRARLTIIGGSPSNVIEYEFGVNATVEPGPEADTEDKIRAQTVTGATAGSVDDFFLTGDLTYFSATDKSALTVEIDGNPVNIEQLPSEPPNGGNGGGGGLATAGISLGILGGLVAAARRRQ